MGNPIFIVMVARVGVSTVVGYFLSESDAMKHIYLGAKLSVGDLVEIVRVSESAESPSVVVHRKIITVGG